MAYAKRVWGKVPTPFSLRKCTYPFRGAPASCSNLQVYFSCDLERIIIHRDEINKTKSKEKLPIIFQNARPVIF
jgi:hypothetical protein